MTKEELQEIIKENRFSNLYCYSEDEIKNLVKEIYFDGMVEGHRIAIDKLQMFNGLPLGSCDSYFTKQEDNIKRILDAIYEYKKST